MKKCWLLSGSLIVLLSTIVSVEAKDDEVLDPEYQAARDTYQETLKTKELSLRADAVEAFSKVENLEVVELLRERYERPESLSYPEELEHIIAGSFINMRRFDDVSDSVEEWVTELKPGKDNWIKYHLLTNLAFAERDDFVASCAAGEMVIKGQKRDKTVKLDPIDQAAAIEALGQSGSPALLTWIVEGMKELPKKTYDQTLLINASASALYEWVERQADLRRERFVENQEERWAEEERKLDDSPGIDLGDLGGEGGLGGNDDDLGGGDSVDDEPSDDSHDDSDDYDYDYGNDLKSRVGEEHYEAFLDAAEALANLLSNEDLTSDNKLIISRYLSKALETENFGDNVVAWQMTIRQLERDEEGDQHVGRTAARTRKPRFFGVVGQGDRIVYVIDVSASMKARVEAQDLSELQKQEEEDQAADEEAKPRGPTTGSRGNESHDDDAESDEDDEERNKPLPWDKIRTRLDLAKESLKASIRGLEPHMKFAVVLFANRTELMKTTPRLIEASSRNIKAAIQEIDGFRLGMLNNGETELHPGLRLAFRVHEKGTVREHEQADDKDAVLMGGNVFYILSDGAPTNDDFTESNEVRPSGLQNGGPYTSPLMLNRTKEKAPFNNTRLDLFKRDIERMSFHRKPEIHCIGIAISHAMWLDALAEVGMGEVKLVGTVVGND